MCVDMIINQRVCFVMLNTHGIQYPLFALNLLSSLNSTARTAKRRVYYIRGITHLPSDHLYVL